MEIPCEEIAQNLKNLLKKEVLKLQQKNIQPKLVTILVGESPAQISFINIKKRIAKEIGVEFEFIQFKKKPKLSDFLSIVKKKSEEKSTTGIIIQHPFPSDYLIDDVYAQVPHKKDIEGFNKNSNSHFPLSLAVLSGIKYIALKETNNTNIAHNSIVNYKNDKQLLQKFLEYKNIVIAGRGITGGKPIAKILNEMNIKFEQTNSKTKKADMLYENADLIITAVGKKIITNKNIKTGVALLNVGLRKDDGVLKGDYDEKEIEGIARYYTKTPKGLGPIDVLYLFKNLIDAS